MRDSYREQLDDILADLVQMCQAVSAAVRSSTTALLEAEIHLAEQVITEDMKLDRMQADIEARAFSLLARQAPVAGELRTLVATLRMVTELERMGDLAAHVAKIARLRYPEIAVPEALRPNFVRMGDVAEKMVVTAGQTLNNRNIESCAGASRPRRGDGRAAQEPVPGDVERQLVVRGGGRGRRRPAGSLLRADRRPRRLHGPPHHLRRHRRVPGDESGPRRIWPRQPWEHRSGACRSTSCPGS